MAKFNFTDLVVESISRSLNDGLIKEDELTGGLALDAWIKVNRSLREDEGFRSLPYNDTGKGGITVGYGRNLTQRPLSKGEALLLSYDDVGETACELRNRFPGDFNLLSSNAQAALVMMSYQMGIGGVLKFKNTLRALIKGDKDATRRGAMDSLWYSRHKKRASKVIDLLVS